MKRFDVELDGELITVEVISYQVEDGVVEFHIVDDDVANRLTRLELAVLKDEVMFQLGLLTNAEEYDGEGEQG